MTQAVILAGGEGTRLRERLGPLPKPLVDICGMPLLERQILLAKHYGTTDVLVLVSYGAEEIAKFCTAKENWGLRLECVDDGEPRGTAGAILAAFDRLTDDFLVMYGDTMLNVDLSRFHAAHLRAPRADATLFVHPNDHPQDSDLVEVDDAGHVARFYPYPHDPDRHYPNLVNAALYWINREALRPWREAGGKLDFGKDLFPAMLRAGLRLRAYRSPEYIKDVGTPARLDRVCADYRSGRVDAASLARPQAAVFLDRDGTINVEVDHLRSPEQFELHPGAADAIRRLNRSAYRCIVVTNQPVVARGECSPDGLRRIHDKMDTLLGRQGAYVDAVFVCPHHPEAGHAGERPELKIDCECRKPKTGLIEQATRAFNVSLGRSWLVGDSSVDIETARRAGLRSVLVETGYGGFDYRFWALPHAVVADLGEAVAFILDRYPLLAARCEALGRPIGPGSTVFIGGQARSGKSTFANVLRDVLAARGLDVVLLSCDRWLKSAAERAPGVLGRYDIDALMRLATAMGDPEERPARLALPGYHKLNRERVDDVESVRIQPSSVVVFEGTIALALAEEGLPRTHRFHIEVEEAERKRRLLREYRLRSYTEASATALYESRLADEYPVIEQLSAGARRFSIQDADATAEAAGSEAA